MSPSRWASAADSCGGPRAMAGGEVKEYSDMYNHTRHLALAATGSRSGQPRSQCRRRRYDSDHVVRPGRERNADGRHRVAQPGAGRACKTGHFRIDRRRTLEPDATRLRPGAAVARFVGLCTRFFRRASRHFSSRSPRGEVNVDDAAGLRGPRKLPWSTSIAKPKA